MSIDEKLEVQVDVLTKVHEIMYKGYRKYCFFNTGLFSLSVVCSLLAIILSGSKIWLLPLILTGIIWIDLFISQMHDSKLTKLAESGEGLYIGRITMDVNKTGKYTDSGDVCVFYHDDYDMCFMTQGVVLPYWISSMNFRDTVLLYNAICIMIKDKNGFQVFRGRLTDKIIESVISELKCYQEFVGE